MRKIRTHEKQNTGDTIFLLKKIEKDGKTTYIFEEIGKTGAKAPALPGGQVGAFL